ncbi:MAG: hypothetical protein JWM99_4168 [Verrucomicrobiales bacterium]|nr:hypothetical protein [Verrucomicrobiales bacterium]
MMFSLLFDILVGAIFNHWWKLFPGLYKNRMNCIRVGTNHFRGLILKSYIGVLLTLQCGTADWLMNHGSVNVVFPPVPPVIQPCVSPGNDHFANAQVLTGTAISVRGSIGCASAEVGEPDHAMQSAKFSVWYQWTAPATDPVLVGLKLPNYSGAYRIGIYLGSEIKSLTNVIENSSPGGEYYFNGEVGRTYSIAVDGDLNFPGSFFDLTLTMGGLRLISPASRKFSAGEEIQFEVGASDPEVRIETVEALIGTNSLGAKSAPPFIFGYAPALAQTVAITAKGRAGDMEYHLLPVSLAFSPQNDAFDRAIQITNNLVNRFFEYSTEYATIEPDEPLYSSAEAQPGYGSLWWKWTPIHAALTTLNSEISDLFIYKGTALTNLELVAHSTPNSIQINAWGGVSFGGGSFKNEIGSTYWFSAASKNHFLTNAFMLSERFHWIEGVSGTNGNVGRPFSIHLAGLADVEAPVSLQIELGHYVYPLPERRKLWVSVLKTNLVNPPNFDWTWEPTEDGEFQINAQAVYSSGESSFSSLSLTFFEENDSFESARLIDSGLSLTKLGFNTEYATSEAGEPLTGTNVPERSVWWRWTPDRDTNVFLKVVGDFGGLPLDVFSGDSLSNLVLQVSNAGRNFSLPFEGVVPFTARRGETYFIRVTDPRPTEGRFDYAFDWPLWLPTIRTNLILTFEPRDKPLRGLLAFKTASEGLQNDGSIDWQVFGRVIETNGISPVSSYDYHAQFFAGRKLTALQPVGHLLSASIYSAGFGVQTQLNGTISMGVATLPDLFSGDLVFVQVRAWDWKSGFTYEIARNNGGVIGRSKILEVHAGSELTGVASLEGIGDVRLEAPRGEFNTGILRSLGRLRNAERWQLTGSPGFIYSIDASIDFSDWQSILVLTNSNGTVSFVDPRSNLAPLLFYRSRIID